MCDPSVAFACTEAASKSEQAAFDYVKGLVSSAPCLDFVDCSDTAVPLKGQLPCSCMNMVFFGSLVVEPTYLAWVSAATF